MKRRTRSNPLQWTGYSWSRNAVAIVRFKIYPAMNDGWIPNYTQVQIAGITDWDSLDTRRLLASTGNSSANAHTNGGGFGRIRKSATK